MNLSVLTPGREIFNGPITSVKVPGISGQFEILKGHAPIVSALGQGEIRIIDDAGKSVTYKIDKGFVEVLHEEVSLLVQGVSDI